MARKNKESQDKRKENKPITNDGRFSSVHFDPRFKLPNLKNFKVKVDERFSKEELKKLNNGSLGKETKIDRYGRKIKNRHSDKDFDRYYQQEENAPKVSIGSDDESSLNSESNNESDDDTDANAVETSAVVDRARGEGLESSSESDISSPSDSDSDEESEEEEEESEIELEDEKPEEGDPSSSFAVVNMDWDNLRAVDLMATFISFVPVGGSIASIKIYPSEYGLQQLAKEEVEGPPRELFKSKKQKKHESESEDSDSDSDSNLDLQNKDDLARATRKLYEEEDGGTDYDSKALRRYQLQKLRYYYAVVNCDSVKTAKSIYDNCDGTEYESTANVFDLRYVPEDMTFDEERVKDICTGVPASYKPNSTFVTDALQHSKVKLTWDETPKERLDLASRNFSQRELDDMDFKAYLASDSDGSEDEKDLKDKYKSLLGTSFNFNGNEKDEDDVDMEITFNPGLDEERARKDEEELLEETTVDAYRRKEKERRKRRMEKAKKAQEDPKASEGDKRVQKYDDSSKEADATNKAQLELLMMDEENDNHEHFNMKDIIKQEKQKKRKKKSKKNIDTEMLQDNFKPDLSDPRFKEVFENRDYAIDPTSSEFKKTHTMNQILNERSKRHAESPRDRSYKRQKNSHKKGPSSDLNVLVNKFKLKHHKK
ncbi:uncharacterized protein PRCAT00000704001 [Priceomyces carsonii]|uniref:uncharacterized protein n=1 Tax=Priceomyces carsonii TaxID=28549 RepID=UPI002ED8C6A9|nr:unnamed protein product [Priceomyces carsonii]